ncbi:hemerythrin domain-containing protein [Clostridium paraputrificum]|uniref:hemerythrin domain-containing protein n=1 Tax=Clostridium TaxID=1485 RepID=UPI003D355CC7
MKAIELLMDEHKYIKRMLLVVRKVCLNIMDGSEVDYEDFYKIIDFIRNYADGHHHNKEEIILFNKMIDEMGVTAEKVIKYGMLVEHDLGRLYISSLDESLQKLKSGDKESRLDVIANAISYTNLLERHIHKEDNVIYKFATRELSEDTLDKINEETNLYEGTNNTVKDKYVELLEVLEEKYLEKKS